MTISLEEHVARAMALINRPGMRWEQRGAEPEAVRQEYFAMARAAIAAVREREGTESQGPVTHEVKLELGWLLRDVRRAAARMKPAPDPAEATRAKCDCARYAALGRVPFTGTAKVEKVCPRAQGHGCVSYCGVDMTDFCSVTGRRV